MTRTDRRKSTESRAASRALQALDRGKSSQPAMDGITEAPTAPRENPPIDEGRVARAHEDYHRVLG